MAELIVKIGTVGPDPVSQDGDIIEAFNDTRISYTNADRLCRAYNIFEIFQAKTCTMKYERVSKTELKETNLRTGVERIIGQPQMDVPQFIQRRLDHPNFPIWGITGKEYFYEGNILFDKLDELWLDIEILTPERKANHALWPLTDIEKRHYLTLSVDNFSDVDAARYMRPVWKDAEQSEMLKKREHRVVYSSIVALAPLLSKIVDKNEIVDIRKNFQFSRAVIVDRKK